MGGRRGCWSAASSAGASARSPEGRSVWAPTTSPDGCSWSIGSKLYTPRPLPQGSGRVSYWGSAGRTWTSKPGRSRSGAHSPRPARGEFSRLLRAARAGRYGSAVGPQKPSEPTTRYS